MNEHTLEGSLSNGLPDTTFTRIYFSLETFLRHCLVFLSPFFHIRRLIAKNHFDQTAKSLVWFGRVGPGFRDTIMGYPIFQGFIPLAKGG